MSDNAVTKAKEQIKELFTERKEMKSVKVIWFLVLMVGALAYFAIVAIDSRAGALQYWNEPNDLNVSERPLESLSVASLCGSEGLEWTSGNPCLIKVTVDNGTGLQLNTYNPQQAGCNEQR